MVSSIAARPRARCFRSQGCEHLVSRLAIRWSSWQDGARMVVDQTSLELLRGSTIDYVQEMIRSSFAVVNNPQSESACGCGSSFAVKNFESNPAMD